MNGEVLEHISTLNFSDAFQTKRSEGPGPFIIADALGDAATFLSESLKGSDVVLAKNLTLELSGYSATESVRNGVKKLVGYSSLILGEIIICSFFNSKGEAILTKVKSAA